MAPVYTGAASGSPEKGRIVSKVDMTYPLRFEPYCSKPHEAGTTLGELLRERRAAMMSCDSSGLISPNT